MIPEGSAAPLDEVWLVWYGDILHGIYATQERAIEVHDNLTAQEWATYPKYGQPLRVEVAAAEVER